MEKSKKKKGLSRLFEIAGQRKDLLILAGLLSAGSAVCMLVPYWAVYEILKELLSKRVAVEWLQSFRFGRNGHDALGMDCIWRACWRIGIAVCSPDVLTCGCIPYLVWVACPFVRTHRQTPVRVSEQYIHRSYQENDGPEHRKDRRIHSPHHSGFGQCSGNGSGNAGHLFLAGCVADSRVPGRCGA